MFPPALRLWLLQRSRFAELCFIHGDVSLYLAEHDGIASVQPGISDVERKLHSVDVAIIGVVDLRGNAADRRVPVTQLAEQQPGLAVEESRHQKAPRPGSLHHIDVVTLVQCHALLQRRLAGWRRKVANGSRRAGLQIRENLLDLAPETTTARRTCLHPNRYPVTVTLQSRWSGVLSLPVRPS